MHFVLVDSAEWERIVENETAFELPTFNNIILLLSYAKKKKKLKHYYFIPSGHVRMVGEPIMEHIL